MQSTDMPEHTVRDQMDRSVTAPLRPQRIISTVPSQTELLYDLGLGHRVAGVTRFCIHPAGELAGTARVGGTKSLSMSRIEALDPDLIIANKEENHRDQIEELADRYPVWISDIRTLEDALDMIRRIGILCDVQAQGEALARKLNVLYEPLREALAIPGAGFAYLIWRRPWMAAGNDTFIHSLMTYMGMANAFGHLSRYPELSEEDLAEARPSHILLSSEPYPFSAKHISELQAICPSARIVLVDGEFFSWYGSRLVPAAAYFTSLKSIF